MNNVGSQWPPLLSQVLVGHTCDRPACDRPEDVRLLDQAGYDPETKRARAYRDDSIAFATAQGLRNPARSWQ